MRVCICMCVVIMYVVGRLGDINLKKKSGKRFLLEVAKGSEHDLRIHIILWKRKHGVEIVHIIYKKMYIHYSMHSI